MSDDDLSEDSSGSGTVEEIIQAILGNRDDPSNNSETQREVWQSELNRTLQLLSKDDATQVQFTITEDCHPASHSELNDWIKNIGGALKGTTRVRFLVLSFEGDLMFLPDDPAVPEIVTLRSSSGVNAHDLLLDFVRTSESLRTFHFGSLDDVGGLGTPLAQSYISALQDNPNITHFRLEAFCTFLVPAICELLRTTKTIQHLELQANDEDCILDRQAVHQICMALGTNESLTSLTFEQISFDCQDDGARTNLDILKTRPQNKLLTQLLFEGCPHVDEESASNFLHTFPYLEKLTTNSLSPFMAYFDLPERVYEREYRPSSIQEFMFVGDISEEQGTPKMKQFIVSQPTLKILNCAFTERLSNRKSLNIIRSIIEGINEQETSALKTLFLDNLIIPKLVMEKLNKLVHGLDEMEFHFAFAGKLPLKATKWLSSPSCALKLLRLNLLRLNDEALGELFPALSQNKSIKTLQLMNLTGYKPFLIPALQDCLSKMKQLRKVTTTSALMVRALCKTTDSNIEELEIVNQNLGRNGILEALASFLSRPDCKLKRLTVSDLESENEEGDEDASENPSMKDQVKLVDALSQNNSLEYLCLDGLEPAIPLFNLAVVLPSLKTLKEISVTISQVWELEPTTLFALKTALLCGLKQNTSLNTFHCDLDEECYSFQKEIVVHCLRNKVRSLALGEDVEIPMEILHHSADFLL